MNHQATTSIARLADASLALLKKTMLGCALLCSAAAWAQNVPPTVSLTAPATNSTYVAPATVAFYSAASDSDGTIQSATLYLNGSPYIPLLADGVGVFSRSVFNLPAGTYVATAVVTDNSGASTTSAPITVIVNANVPPTVSLTAPATNSTYVAPATVAFYSAASDSDGTIASAQLYLNGNSYIQLLPDGVGVFSRSVFNLPAGTYVATAVVTDNSGASTTSAPITVIVNGNAPPTVSMAAPANNSVWSEPGTFTVSASASDSDGTISSVYFLYDGGGFGGYGTLDANGKYSIFWNNIPAGTHTIRAVATDNNNATTTSAPITIVVNPNVLPTVTMTSPANNSVWVVPGTFTVSAIATDSDGTIASVYFLYDGSGFGGNGTLDANGKYSIFWNNIPVGTHTIRAVATDNSGGVTTSAPITIVVNVSAAPTVAITAPAQGHAFGPVPSVLLTASAADSDGTVTGVQFYNGATLLGSGSLTSGTAASGIYSYTLTGPATGSYSVTAVATDNTGVVTTSDPVAFTVNPNSQSMVSITSPPGGGVFVAPAEIPLAANATNNDGSVTQVQFFSGGTLIGTGVSNGTGGYSLAWTGVAAGTYTLTAMATDNLGATTTSAAVSIAVNTATAGGTTGMFAINVDHLNTPRLVEDQNQQTVWKWDQAEPFGDSAPNQSVGSGGAFVFNLRFPGQYVDIETNTSYNYFRDYDPAAGRYVQSDPIGLEGGLNPYMYVDGNPIFFSDPWGLQWGRLSQSSTTFAGPGTGPTIGPRNQAWATAGATGNLHPPTPNFNFGRPLPGPPREPRPTFCWLECPKAKPGGACWAPSPSPSGSGDLSGGIPSLTVPGCVRKCTFGPTIGPSP